MKTLNISHPDKTDIRFEVIKFPDGQQSIKLGHLDQILPNEEISIHSRLSSFLDLELIISANQVLREYGYTKVSLYVPYFLGARSDRKFEAGTSNYLKTVICPIINSQNFFSVKVLDPHSDVLEACIDRIKIVHSCWFVKHAFDLLQLDSANTILVSPDAGALKKVYASANLLGFEDVNVLTATKHREISTGRILSTYVPLGPHCAGKEFVIADDICDGGRTFIEIAKVIRQAFPTAKIHLIVTHGIFSAGIEPLKEYFTTIVTSDSVKSDEQIQSMKDSDIVKIINSELYA